MNAATGTRCVTPAIAAAYAAGELSERELSQVEEHVDECSLCRRILSNAAQLALSGSIAGHLGHATTVAAPGDAPPPLSVRSVVGRYVVEGYLGAGGMGAVYSAQDTELKRRVALKVLRAGLPVGEEILRREAMAMARLAHPNVVGVYDLFASDGALYLAMELVEGTTLRQWLPAERRGWREILRTFVLAGQGLAAAHAEGLVHRDFKPDNVLIGRSGRVCVADFGLSRAAELVSPGMAGPERGDESALRFAGTPRYMAPEQRRGDGASARSDQFSFCVALYEALWGAHPFPAGSERRAGPAPVEPARMSAPAWVRRCVMRGLAPRPEDRYPRMDDLLRDLQRDPWALRRRLAGVALVGGTVGAGLLGWGHVRTARLEHCVQADGAFGEVWGAARRQSAAGAFARVATPFASDAWAQVQRALDGYTARWVEARRRACSVALARADAAPIGTDAAIGCLDDRLAEARALTERLSSLEGSSAVAGAVVAADSLRPVEPCARAVRARQEATAAQIDQQRAIRADLANATVLAFLGRDGEAAVLGARAALAAETADLRVLLGRALLRAGFSRMRSMRGEWELAEAELYRSAAVADEAGDDRTRVEALGAILFLNAEFKSNLTAAGAARLFEQAIAAERRFGGDERLEALLHADLGAAARMQGDFAKARAEYLASVQLSERDGDSLGVGRVFDNLGMMDGGRGDLTAAKEEFARADDALRKALGEFHPTVAQVLGNLAYVRLETRDFAGARDDARRALAAYDAAAARDGLNASSAMETVAQALLELNAPAEAVEAAAECLGVRERAQAPPARLRAPLADLGRAQLALGRPELALPSLERARAIEGGDAEGAADVNFALARALVALRRDPERARALATQAADALAGMREPTPLQAAKRAEIAVWQQEAPSLERRP